MEQGDDEVYDEGEAAQIEEGEGDDAGFDEDELDSALADVQGAAAFAVEDFYLCNPCDWPGRLLIFLQEMRAATNPPASSGCSRAAPTDQQVFCARGFERGI